MASGEDASNQGALRVKKGERGLNFWIWVQPRASRDEVCGLSCGALRVRVSAPAVEGKANKALVEFLSSLLGVSKTQIQIISGEKGRRKLVQVKGISLDELSGVLKGIPIEETQ